MKKLLLFAVSLSQNSAFAAGRSGVLANFRQLPVVQRVGEVLQGTGSSLARKAVALGMLAAAACSTIGCGEDSIDALTKEG